MPACDALLAGPGLRTLRQWIWVVNAPYVPDAGPAMGQEYTGEYEALSQKEKCVRLASSH